MKETACQVGIWIYPADSVQSLVHAVIAADRAGLDEVWIADEGVARDPLVVFAAAAAQTERVRLGIGITSPLLRHPGAIASSVATLDELSGGRAMLGFGVGGEQSLQPFGITMERPVALIRDAIRTARAVIRRSESEEYTPPAHAAPGRDLPIYVGARGEQLNRLASREADGVFLSGFDLERVGAAVELARSVRPVHVALYASVRFSPDGPADPSCLRGSPADVAAGMRALVELHRPQSIGLALVDGATPTAHVELALEAIRLFPSETSPASG